MNIELTAEQAEQFKKEGKITIEMPKAELIKMFKKSLDIK